jgi:hypothetical protein
VHFPTRGMLRSNLGTSDEAVGLGERVRNALTSKLGPAVVLAWLGAWAILSGRDASLAQAPPPPNDDFPGETITSLPFYDAKDSTYATVGSGDVSGLFHTVWYTFTAPEAMTLAVDTWESAPAKVALFTAETLQTPGGSTRGAVDECPQGIHSRTFTMPAGE